MIPKILHEASRQYRHNSSDELVSGFDKDETIKIVTGLQAEIASLIKSKAAWMEEFNKAQAEIDELKADAERYRWMRDEENWGADNGEWGDLGQLSLGDFDSYVDALIAKHKGEKCVHCDDKVETTDANNKPACYPCAYNSAT